MKNILKVTALITALASAPISANENDSAQIAKDALTCSGLYYVMSGLGGPNTEPGSIFFAMSDRMSTVYAFNMNNLNDTTLTEKEVSDTLKSKAHEIATIFKDNPDIVLREYAKCDNWQFPLEKYFDEKSMYRTETTKEKFRQYILAVPVASEDYSFHPNDRTPTAKSMVDYAFKSYIDAYLN